MILLSGIFVSKRPRFLFADDGFDALMLQKNLMIQLFYFISNEINLKTVCLQQLHVQQSGDL